MRRMFTVSPGSVFAEPLKSCLSLHHLGVGPGVTVEGYSVLEPGQETAIMSTN